MDFEYKSDIDLFEFIMVSELKVLNSTNESCTVEANSYTVGYSHFINKQRGTLVKVTLAATTDLVGSISAALSCLVYPPREETAGRVSGKPCL